MTRKIFSEKQKAIMVAWVVFVSGGGGYLLYRDCLSFDDIEDTLLQICVPLLGFALLTTSIISSIDGSDLAKRLKETRAYYSLITNLYYLLITLFIGTIIGFVLRHIKYTDLPEMWVFILNILVLVLITLIFNYFWYAATRFFRAMRQVGNDEKNKSSKPAND